MFPFTLERHEFFSVFIVLCMGLLLVHLFLWLILRSLSSAKVPRLSELAAHPYKVAYLRGGTKAMFRVAVINLVDRGLLVPVGTAVRRLKDAGADYVRQPLDKAILEAAPMLKEAGELQSDPRVRRAGEAFQAELRAKGLLLGEGPERVLWGSVVLAALVLGAVLLVRAVQRVEGSGPSSWWLLLWAGITLVIATRLTLNRTTGAGLRTLRSLQTLAEATKRRLEDGVRPTPGTNGLALCAALFGIYSLPVEQYAYVDQLFGARGDRGGWDVEMGGEGGGGDGDGGGCGGCGGGCGE